MNADQIANIEQQANSLLEFIRSHKSCVVAFSGGVDSALVAQASVLALGPENCLAVTAHSPSLPQRELETACQVANQIGIKHRVIETREMELEDYLENSKNRCFYCKSELYHCLEPVVEQTGFQSVFNGSNLDDFSDYRPGLQAAANYQVVSPLAECQLDKTMVRQIANLWQIPVWNKPASPCLSSRIAYGERVDSRKLQMIESAEDWLLAAGFEEVRVRYHTGDIARIEVAEPDFARFQDSDFRRRCTSYLRELGFQFVSIDLEGFRSGSMNRVLQTVQIGASLHD